MPLPANVSTGTVTGKFMNVAGQAHRGTVTFRPSFDRGLNSGADTIFTPEKVTVSLDTNGAFSVVLAATNDPDLVPLNFTYIVDISIAGVYDSLFPSFPMSLLAGTTKDLTDVMP